MVLKARHGIGISQFIAIGQEQYLALITKFAGLLFAVNTQWESSLDMFEMPAIFSRSNYCGAKRMSFSARAIASQFCDLMPIIERAVSSELRRGNQYVTPSHLQLLAALARGPSSLSGLSEIMAVSLPTMSNSVTTFVERGWVKRTQSANDRRYVKVELTEKGWKALVDIRKRVEMLFTAHFASLPATKREDLKGALKILQEIFRRKLGDAGNGIPKKTGISPVLPKRTSRR